MTLVVSAPGKVILCGEHSVVYGKTALAVALNLRTTLTLQCRGVDTIDVNLPDVGFRHRFNLSAIRSQLLHSPSIPAFDDSQQDLVRVACFLSKIGEFLSQQEPCRTWTPGQTQALLSFFFLLCGIYSTTGKEIPPLEVEVRSELNVGSGVGSSAAFCVCVAASFLHLVLGDLSTHRRPLVSAWAFRGEQILHGKASGVDNSVCTFGSVIRFNSGQIREIPEVFKLRILLVDSGVARNTAAMVAKVANRKEKFPGIVEPILTAMDEVANTMEQILQQLAKENSSQEQKARIANLEELMDVNHALLCSLGVSHPRLQEVCRVAASHGFHAKLTGAGGGGNVYILLPPEASDGSVTALKRELSGGNFQFSDTLLGGDGVRVESFS